MREKCGLGYLPRKQSGALSEHGFGLWFEKSSRTRLAEGHSGIGGTMRSDESFQSVSELFAEMI
jgi:hypothetical protein